MHKWIKMCYVCVHGVCVRVYCYNYVLIMQYYMVIGKKNSLLFVTWMDPKGLFLSKIRQREKYDVVTGKNKSDSILDLFLLL